MSIFSQIDGKTHSQDNEYKTMREEYLTEDTV